MVAQELGVFKAVPKRDRNISQGKLALAVTARPAALRLERRQAEVNEHGENGLGDKGKAPTKLDCDERAQRWRDQRYTRHGGTSQRHHLRGSIAFKAITYECSRNNGPTGCRGALCDSSQPHVIDIPGE